MAMSTSSARYLPAEWTLPAVNPQNAAFFTNGRNGELSLQRCRRCAATQHPPEEVCRECQSTDFDYVAVKPTGTVVSFSIVHHPVHPSLRQVVPYNVVVVSLDEHPDVRIVGNVIDAEAAAIEVGLPVICTWAEVAGSDAESIFLPQWRVR